MLAGNRIGAFGHADQLVGRYAAGDVRLRRCGERGQSDHMGQHQTPGGRDQSVRGPCGGAEDGHDVVVLRTSVARRPRLPGINAAGVERAIVPDAPSITVHGSSSICSAATAAASSPAFLAAAAAATSASADDRVAAAAAAFIAAAFTLSSP